MVIIEGCDAYPNQKTQLQLFAEAMDVEKIVYQDKGKSEIYTLSAKNGEKIQLIISGNQYDGGYMNIKFL